jgi:hypothetical protein
MPLRKIIRDTDHRGNQENREQHAAVRNIVVIPRAPSVLLSGKHCPADEDEGQSYCDDGQNLPWPHSQDLARAPARHPLLRGAKQDEQAQKRAQCSDRGLPSATPHIGESRRHIRNRQPQEETIERKKEFEAVHQGCAPTRDLTRHKISDRWRGRAWLRVECGSHRKWERRAASGSLHRLVRPWREHEQRHRLRSDRLAKMSGAQDHKWLQAAPRTPLSFPNPVSRAPEDSGRGKCRQVDPREGNSERVNEEM